VKWALYALGLFVALIVLVFLIGSSLAEQHAATRVARFHQSPETIWGVITDYSRFPQWRKNVTRVEPLPAVNGKPSWRTTTQFPTKLSNGRRLGVFPLELRIPICPSAEPGPTNLLRRRMATPRCALLRTVKFTMFSFASWLAFSSDTQQRWKVI
jgi:hypothetical protein